jgi:2'-5' RNA ligase
MHEAPAPTQKATDAQHAADPASVAAASGTARVGVAFGIPEPWGSQLDRRRAESGDPLAPYIPAHVTLLGPTDVATDALPAIEVHLAEVAARHRPYPMHLRGTGTFRPVTEVVFVAVARGISDCERLAGEIRTGPLDRELQYPYHPHVTVAHDISASALDTLYEQLAGFTARFTVTSFTLYVHGVDGRWRPVRDFPLGGSPDGPRRSATERDG